ncbi:MAG: site-specific integrase [Bacteroidota bacterium]
MSEFNYSQLRIVSSSNLKNRSYVCFYFNGKRIREYNGNNLGLDIKPNYATTIDDRERLLRKLHFELQKALENNCYPAKIQINEIAVQEEKNTCQLLNEALEKKLSSNLSKFYKRNLNSIYNHFTAFLSTKELSSPIAELKRSRVEEFLTQFNSSGTYYMNKRRDLGVMFSSVSKQIEQKLMIVLNTDTVKSKAKLHKIYDKEQIKPILDHLKSTHPNLHLCCLLCYGCFLRPHEEIRNLCVYHFKNDFSEVHLSGNENKGGRVRVVFVPEYVRKELLLACCDLEPSNNLFTKTDIPFNEAYFNTAWTRSWRKMYAIGLIHKNQTIYSFRHTSVVNIYKKTKDIHILQKLLGHSDMIVTLKYLRGLGELNSDDLKNVMPEL